MRSDLVQGARRAPRGRPCDTAVNRGGYGERPGPTLRGVHDWWVIGPSFGVAAGTFALAVATFSVNRSARDEAKATGRMVDEMRRDRELVWRAWITVRDLRGGGTQGAQSEGVLIANTGSSPALGCRWARRWDGGGWAVSGPIDLAPSAERFEVAEPQPAGGPVPEELFVPPVHGEERTARAPAAAFCRDVLGRRYRFPMGTDGHLRTPEVWDPTTGDDPPPWAVSQAIWPA